MLGRPLLCVFFGRCLIFVDFADVLAIANGSLVAHGVGITSICVSAVEHISFHTIVVALFALVEAVERDNACLLLHWAETLLRLHITNEGVFVIGAGPVVRLARSSKVSAVGIFIFISKLEEVRTPVKASRVTILTENALLESHMVSGCS